MAQTITDYSAFLTDAREAVEELAGLERREAELEAQEKRLERTLEAEKKAVADAIHSTIRRRNEEICSSYDKEIAKGQERLKKIRSKREKAKSQGVKDRIAEETSEIRSHNRELRIKMRTLFQQKHVPFFCNSGCYYALFSPRGVREFFALSWRCPSGSTGGFRRRRSSICLRSISVSSWCSGGSISPSATGPKDGTATPCGRDGPSATRSRPTTR